MREYTSRFSPLFAHPPPATQLPVHEEENDIFGPGEAAPSHSEVHDRDGPSVEYLGRDLDRGRGLPSPWGLRARVEPDNAAHLGGAENAAAEPE